MKVCTQCHVEQPEAEFHWRSKAAGKRISQCRTCKNAWAQKDYQRNSAMYRDKTRTWSARSQADNRSWIINYLEEHPCVDCGEDDPVVLQFDHVRGVKHRAVSEMLIGAHSRLVTEVAKCDVRCANCHTRKTAGERNYYRAANAR